MQVGTRSDLHFRETALVSELRLDWVRCLCISAIIPCANNLGGGIYPLKLLFDTANQCHVENLAWS